MPPRTTIAIALVVAIALVGVMGAAVQSPAGQSLAEVARQEQERRKGIKDAGKLYTNKDLPSVPPAAALPAPAVSKPDASPVATQGDGKPEPAKPEAARPEAKDQAYWNGRIAALREQLDRDRTLTEALQARINALATDFVNRDDPAQRAQIGTDRRKALGELDRLKKGIEDDKKAIADIEEEARRAGVPPGWLR